MRFAVVTSASLGCVLASLGVYGLGNDAENDVNSYMAKISVSPAAQSTQSADRESAKTALLSGNATQLGRFQPRIGCPESCSQADGDKSGWYLYGGFDALRRACNRTMLLEFSLFNPVDEQNSRVAISACAAPKDASESSALKRQSSDASSCARKGVSRTKTTSSLQLSTSGSSSAASLADVTASLDLLKTFLGSQDANCTETVNFASSGNAAVGVYAGSGFAGQGVLNTALEKLHSELSSGRTLAAQTVVQMCGNSTARYTLGIYIGTDGKFGPVQQALQSWKNGTCVDVNSAAKDWHSVTFESPSALNGSLQTNNTASKGDFSGNSSSSQTRRSSPVTLIGRGDDCNPIDVQAGDNQDTLAQECGISTADFAKFNPRLTNSKGLVTGQQLCCSADDAPRAKRSASLAATPQPDKDGYCYAYLVKVGDNCSALSAKYGFTNDDLEEWNKKTWGWNGCAKMFAKYAICLSKGYPPMPAPVANAVCGPQVAGTGSVPPDVDMTTLNQCRLNACCNIWGQCGTTVEFCTPSKSPTGAPGTAAPGENGCISNCGTDVITGDAPKDNYKIAYFEAFDWTRPCLRMGADQIDTSKYTHAHYSFAVLTGDLAISVKDTEAQFNLFKGLSGIKKIIAIGGWAFSTDPGTYQIFRDAFSGQGNRDKVINNIVNFIKDNNLDGVDWDWEYPDEPDIPGIPKGSPDDQVNFYLFLQQLKAKMPNGKTVSVTAPASFWYLQHFPIQAISLVVDYIVYMTYDLHGQWDYINKYASPGCGSYDQGLGNCLRSHVNLTETINALSMITKAGVPSTMIVVGVSSYGRSFQMSQAGCWTEQCTYTGPESGAYKGRCTGTAGYISDFEINEILAHGSSAQSHFDAKSYSDIVVFNNTQWVAHMTPKNKAFRTLLYKNMKFLGTADWAVDLQSESGTENGGDSFNKTIWVDPGIWHSATPAVTAQPGMTLIWPPMPLGGPTTITFPPWTTEITYSSLTTRTETKDGTTTTYPGYFRVTWDTVLTIPPLTTTAIPVWGVSLNTSTTGGVIILTSSVQPPPMTVTVTPVINGTTSIVSPTSTTTTTPVPIIWGTRTYTPPVRTKTYGKSTIIIGGQTLPPTPIIITPNPHPVTTPTPGTTDPVLNSKTPKWTSGKTPGPTATPDCEGCGKQCLLWCDPGCPFCPPGVFGPGGGSSSGDPDDPDDPDEDDDPDEYTALFEGVLTADSYPGFAGDAEASSADAMESSIFNSDWSSYLHPPTTTTTTTTTTKSPPPKPTPRVDCTIYDSGFFYSFSVYNIEGWGDEDGSSLHHEENGCGALTGWEWHKATEHDDAYAHFNLPFFIKAGCVERAIHSAGGPKIDCKGGGIGLRSIEDVDDADESSVGVIRRSKMRMTAPPLPYTAKELEEFTTFYMSLVPSLATMSTHNPYEPMNWAVTSVVPTLINMLPTAV